MTIPFKILTSAFKALCLAFTISLAFSCTENKPSDTGTETSPPKDEAITISGTVKALSFGKDGYTAEVQTDTDGTYAALVSIVNLGGRENYKPCEVGDKVSFKGVPSVLGDAKQLKVTEIVNITAAGSQ